MGLFQMKQRVVGRGTGVVAEDDSAVVVNRGKDGFLIQWENSSIINNISNHTLYHNHYTPRN